MRNSGITTTLIGQRDLRDLFAPQYGAIEHPPVVGTTFDTLSTPSMRPVNAPSVVPAPAPEPGLPAE
jgi:hypothetical protein